MAHLRPGALPGSSTQAFAFCPPVKAYQAPCSWNPLHGKPPASSAAAPRLLPPVLCSRPRQWSTSKAGSLSGSLNRRGLQLCCSAAAGGKEPGSTAADATRLQQAEQGTGAPPPPQQEQQQRLDTNVWAYKPAWCQPYSILATGAAIVGGVWAVSGGSPGWTAAASLPVGAWWYLFLIIYPAQFAEYVEQVNAEQLRQQQQQGREAQG